MREGLRLGTFGCAKEAGYAQNVECMNCLTCVCGGYYMLTVPYSVPKRKSFGEGGTNMPWYRITVELSGNIEADSREAAEAEVNQTVKELAEDDEAKCEGKLISCVEVV